MCNNEDFCRNYQTVIIHHLSRFYLASNLITGKYGQLRTGIALPSQISKCHIKQGIKANFYSPLEAKPCFSTASPSHGTALV